MALVRLYATTSMSRDAGGQRSASITWRADGAASAAAAMAMFDNDPTLKIHPDDPSLPFDRIDIFPSPTGVEFRVTAVFSSFRGGRLSAETPPRDDPNWHQFDRSRRRGEVEFAVNSREWRKSDNASFEPYMVWTLKKVRVPTVFPRRILRRRFRDVIDQSIFDPIDKQLGNIHRFVDGQYMHFVDAETKQVDAGSWDVSYTWESDPGTYWPVPTITDTMRPAYWNEAQYPIPLGLVGRFARAPFGQIVSPIVPADPRVEPFMVIMGTTGKIDEEGWRSLPGTEVL